MLENYIDYRIDKLIADYEVNKITLINLKTQLEDLDGWSSGNQGERVQSSPSGDGMDKILIRRNQIEGTIAEYEKILNYVDESKVDDIGELFYYVHETLNLNGCTTGHGMH